VQIGAAMMPASACIKFRQPTTNCPGSSLVVLAGPAKIELIFG
jgi:hypothetical protein